MTYNGYRNFATWSVASWLDNDYYDVASDWVEEALDKGLSYSEALEFLEGRVEDYVQELYYQAVDGIDPMINQALLSSPESADIRYDEVADAIIGHSHADWEQELRSRAKASSGVSSSQNRKGSGQSGGKADPKAPAKKQGSAYRKSSSTSTRSKGARR